MELKYPSAMLEWKREERFRSKIRMPASKLLLIPILYLIINTAVQFWNIHSSQKESLDIISSGRRSILSIEDEENCTKPAVLDFPQVKFPGGERGRLLFSLGVSIYFYILLARLCDDYFIDSIKIICSKIGFTGDVAGATLMAAATSSPELFVHMVGTFVTEGNIGIGTIVGSAMFNVLALPGLCGIFSVSTKVIELEVWPLFRDSVMYCISLVILYLVLRDNRINWYESGFMVLAYLTYIILMRYNKALKAKFEALISNFKPTPDPWESNAKLPLLRGKEGNGYLTHNGNLAENGHLTEKEYLTGSGHLAGNGHIVGSEHLTGNGHLPGNGHTVDIKEHFAFGYEEDDGSHLCCWPTGASFLGKIWWISTFPITAMLACTIPNCRRENRRRFYMLTFVLCICWIAISSYVIAWMITITGFVVKVPDSVMGLTFIAAGMCIPETISSIIVTKQGHGSMALANSFGSNIFDMLFCFGLPWLIKSVYFVSSSATGHYIEVNSKGLNYHTIILFTTIALLILILALNKFILTKMVGYVCLVMYFIFITFMVIIELEVFDVGEIPICSID